MMTDSILLSIIHLCEIILYIESDAQHVIQAGSGNKYKTYSLSG